MKPRLAAPVFNVMAGLVPAIHVFAGGGKDVDSRHKGGYDDAAAPGGES
jgi:hypothetical protein